MHRPYRIACALALCAAVPFVVYAKKPVRSAPPRAVPTFESIGVYWTPPANPGSAGCTLQYRRQGEATWHDALGMWYDSRNGECRGSIVQLAAGTDYELRVGMPGKPPSASVTVTTWSEQYPVARTISFAPALLSQPLAITDGGTPGGYVVYDGAGATIDVASAYANAVTISAPYVILRNFTLRGARKDAIALLSGAHDVVIERNDISGWGSYRTTLANGVQAGNDYEAGVRCESVPALTRVVIQRNRIHDPRYSANSWSYGHPIGPQGITFNYCGGNNVIRYNEITGADGHYYNDGIGGSDNFSTTGFPNSDSDIYGNIVANAWDDAIEAEGGNRNVRIWGNYLDQTTTGVATTATHWGPVYIFRNVYNRSRQFSEVPADSDDRNTFAKSGSTSSYGNGRRYVFHNTLLQAANPDGTYPLGAGGGVTGSGSSQPMTNTVTRNNILHIWKSWWSSIEDYGGSANDVDYDLYNGNIVAYRGAEAHGIVGTAVYADGNGWQAGSAGAYQLAPGSAGYGAGARIPNFNDGFAAPDIGAHQSGTPPMCFGVSCAGTSSAP